MPEIEASPLAPKSCDATRKSIVIVSVVVRFLAIDKEMPALSANREGAVVPNTRTE